MHALWALALVSLLAANAHAQEYSYPRLPPPNEAYSTPAPTPEPKPKSPEQKHRGLQGGFNIGVNDGTAGGMGRWRKGVLEYRSDGI